MAEQVLERVVAVVATYTETPREEITPASTFEELAIDSLDGLSIMADLEDQFSVAIPNDEALDVTTVGEIVAALERHLAGAETPAAAPGETPADPSAAA